MKHYYETLLHLPVHLLDESYAYIRMSDSAHNEEHIRAVVLEADRLACLEGPGFQLGDMYHKAIVMAALCHDLGCSVRGGRDNHEIYSKQIWLGLVDEYEYKACFKRIVGRAIEQHRASYAGERISLGSKIVAAADRGKPNLPVLFLRAYLYTKEINDVDHDTAIRHALKYNVAKFGKNGYARMQDNPIIREYYYEEALQLEEDLEGASIDLVEECLEKFALC